MCPMCVSVMQPIRMRSPEKETMGTCPAPGTSLPPFEIAWSSWSENRSAIRASHCDLSGIDTCCSDLAAREYRLNVSSDMLNSSFALLSPNFAAYLITCIALFSALWPMVSPQRCPYSSNSSAHPMQYLHPGNASRRSSGIRSSHSRQCVSDSPAGVRALTAAMARSRSSVSNFDASSNCSIPNFPPIIPQ